jgi:UDP-N-acetylglucosamine--N-acetylmuramyl-(pentapeptide) pyrophosphoryl-undecaprenol N-acetylglucosamine transferase
MTTDAKINFVFAGGGTGGHLFPALAVAEQLMKKLPNAHIVFVGRKDKLEARIVPQAGYEFKPIIVEGFYRNNAFKNIVVIVKLIIGLFQALALCMKLKPAAVVATGGYISGPAAIAGRIMGAKIVLIEPNSYPGVTTRLLEKQADEIYLAFEDSKKYLRNKDKLFITGNPVRSSLKISDRAAACRHFNLNPELPVLLVMGGSLGAKAFNGFIAEHVEDFKKNKIQVIWQTGKIWYDEFKKFASPLVYVTEFIDEMEMAFSAADLLMSRAGATIVAEIASLGMASILIPSPNVAENHQYYNAKALESSQASILIQEKEMKAKLYDAIVTTIGSKEQLLTLSANVKKLSNEKSSEIIAERVIKLTI